MSKIIEFVPEWAKHVVWYQIFPERFRNGNPAVNPDKDSLKGAYPDDDNEWRLSPWTSDWYKLQPWEVKNNKGLWYNIQRRRYGGDIRGIIDKLDYLKDLGIGAIYLNPVFESPSHHKYDGATYHHIDPYLGPDPQGDKKLIKNETPDDTGTWVWTQADRLFLELIREVHERAMYIIIDGVFNHMGYNSWALQDVIKQQQNSAYKDWFKIRSWDNPVTGAKFQYDGWWGVKELPELRQDENGLVAGPKEYIFNATRRWMDPFNNGNTSNGIDGWRLDVAALIKHGFWKDWRKYVRSINSNTYLVAEIVDDIKTTSPYVQGDEFDATMNYNFMFTCIEYFVQKKEKLTASEFDKKLHALISAYPQGVAYVMQNLLDSHDTNRILSHIVNRGFAPVRKWAEYYEISKASNELYNTGKPGPDDIRKLKLMLIFQMTFIGAPMIYYGDEAGMWGANDPCCRKPMLWDDMQYDDEMYLPDQSRRQQSFHVEVNKELLNFYKTVIGIRNKYEALRAGSFKTIPVDDDKDVYVFERALEQQRLIIALNNSSKHEFVEIENPEPFTDLISNKSLPQQNGRVSLSLPPVSGMILI